MVITWKIIYVITPHVSSFIFSVKMIKHKIHMNSKVARNLLLLCIHLSLRAKNCWRLITYFACKIIHVITPCVSSFSVSVKIINHKIHMNCFNELQILQDGLWWWWDHSVWVLEDGLWWWWDHSVWVLQVGLWSNFRDFRELLMAPSSVVRIGWDFYRSSLTIRGTTCEIFEQIGRRATALLAFEFRAVGAR